MKKFKFYAFDWDDNILHMETKIYVDIINGDGSITSKDLSTSEFAEYRRNDVNIKPRNGSYDEMFSEFRDREDYNSDKFLNQCKEAIENGRFAPSFGDLKECLINGHIFTIITARGHLEHNIRKGIEYIIDNILTESEREVMYSSIHAYEYYYKKSHLYENVTRIKKIDSSTVLIKKFLDRCFYIGVSNPELVYSKYPSEKAKELALNDFKDRVIKISEKVGAKATIGFSDDDLKYVNQINEYVKNLSPINNDSLLKIVIKNTNNPNNITKFVKSFDEVFSEDTYDSKKISNNAMSPATSGNTVLGAKNPFLSMRTDDIEYMNRVRDLSDVDKDLEDMKNKNEEDDGEYTEN